MTVWTIVLGILLIPLTAFAGYFGIRAVKPIAGKVVPFNILTGRWADEVRPDSEPQGPDNPGRERLPES